MPDEERSPEENQPENISATAAAAEPPGKTPEEELAELKKQLEEKEKALNQETKERDELKKEFEAKSKVVNDVNSAVKTFDQGTASLKQDVEAIDNYAASKSQDVEHALGENKKLVDDKIKAVDDLIEAKRQAVAATEAKAKAAGTALDNAKKNLEAKQQAYKNLKDLQTKIVAAVQKLKDYKAKAQQADDQTKRASVYVYLQELKKVRAQIIFPTAEEFKDALNSASAAQKAAEDDVVKKKGEWDAAKADLSKEQPELKKLEDKRLEDALKAVDQFNK